MMDATQKSPTHARFRDNDGQMVTKKIKRVEWDEDVAGTGDRARVLVFDDDTVEFADFCEPVWK